MITVDYVIKHPSTFQHLTNQESNSVKGNFDFIMGTVLVR